MRITNIRVYQHDLVVAGGLYEMSTSEVASLDTTVVVIETDTGLLGFGETCPLGPTYQPQHALGARAAIAEVAPALIGLDPRQPSVVYAAMNAALSGSVYGKSAIDVACWDLAGKAYGARVADLLGGVHRERVPSYYGIMPGTPAECAAKASELMEAGFPRIQVKCGARSLQEDIAAVRAVAEVLPSGVPLMADANRGWTQREAINFSHATRDIALALEQPCDTLADHYAIQNKVCHPIFLDESADSVANIMDAISSGLAQGFGMKISRVGGLTPMSTVRDMAAARRIPHTVDDTWGGDILAASCVHMAASCLPTQHEGTWLSEPYTSQGYAMKSAPITNHDGWIDLPTGPGLGVEPDLEAWGDPLASY